VPHCSTILIDGVHGGAAELNADWPDRVNCTLIRWEAAVCLTVLGRVADDHIKMATPHRSSKHKGRLDLSGTSFKKVLPVSLRR